jgi:hypothetical protein
VLVCIARQLGTTEDLDRTHRKRVYDRAAGLRWGGLAEDAPWMCLMPHRSARGTNNLLYLPVINATCPTVTQVAEIKGNLDASVRGRNYTF